VPFQLNTSSDVTLEIWDLAGKKRAEISKGGLTTGSHQIEVNLSSLGIPHATYVYQLVVKNANGIFRQSKVMTVVK
jgi:hypothetical protein